MKNLNLILKITIKYFQYISNTNISLKIKRMWYSGRTCPFQG